MRTTLLCLAVLVVGFPEGVTAQQAPRTSRMPATRIAVYDSRVVFDSMPERSAVESEFALEQAKARTMVAEASDSLRLALDELVKVEERLTPREREAGKLNLRARELLVEQMLENLDGVIQQRLEELRGPLLRRIREAVRVVRVREGYHLALDRATGGVEIDVDETIDITSAIVAELRRSNRDRPLPASRETPGRSLRQRPIG
jgi:Skp family chaperone for outer membrane proteins